MAAVQRAPSGSQDLHLQRITSELANRRRGTVEEAPDSRHERPAVKIKAIIGHDKYIARQLPLPCRLSSCIRRQVTILHLQTAGRRFDASMLRL